MKLGLIAGAGALALSAAAIGQTSGPLQVAPVAAAPTSYLPANTEVMLSMNQELTTRGDTWNEGDTFGMSVVHDVIQDGYVVIPRGSRATGRINWLTSKGAFGKSGKMDIEMMYIEVSGQRIDIDGTYRQEGEGNTVATVGGVIVAGPFAAFITGKSGTIPQGRELSARTENNIPLAIPASAVPAAPVGLPVQSAAPTALSVEPAAAE
jgi:hypothetical protein